MGRMVSLKVRLEKVQCKYAVVCSLHFALTSVKVDFHCCLILRMSVGEHGFNWPHMHKKNRGNVWNACIC